MSAQFIHVESYARKATGNKTTTAKGVIGEVLRESGFCSHVALPDDNPKFLLGDAESLRLLNEVIHIQADEAKDGQGRKMRTDQTILVAGTMSYPKPTKALTVSDKQGLNDWMQNSLEFCKKEFGTNLQAMLVHLDEEYPHIHFYVANTDNVYKTKDLHPSGGAGKDKKNRIENLKKFQDRYYEQVSIYSGHTRTGPKRERLSRQDWQEKKAEAAEIAAKLKELAKKEEKVNKLGIQYETALAEVAIEKAELSEHKKELQEQLNKLVVMAGKYEKLNEKAIELTGSELPLRKPREVLQADRLVLEADELMANLQKTTTTKTTTKPQKPFLG